MNSHLDPSRPGKSMAKFHSSLALALLATSGALWAVLSPSAAQAEQSSSLQELSRQMLGTNFQTDTSLTLEGSPSVVESGRQSVKPVVGNLIDEEVRRRPGQASLSAGGKTAVKTVQLVIPVQTGLEFAQIQEVEPGAKILEMDGRVFVLVRETAQALPAYERGKQLQQKFGFAFELAYSDGHPDLNLAWMGQPNLNLASRPKPVLQPLALAKPSKPIESSGPGKAQDLGVSLSFSAPWLTDPVQPTAAILSASKLPAPLAVSATLAAQSEYQPSSQASSVKIAAAPVNPVKADPSSSSNRRSSLRDTLAELRQMTESASSRINAAPIAAIPAVSIPATSRPAAVALQQPLPEQFAVSQAATRSLVQAVAIRPTHVGDTPIVSTRFMAVNQDLAYLFVKVRNPEDLIAVQKVAPVAVVHDRNGELLAQVGVFNQSRTGERLRDQQLVKLQESGYQIEFVAARHSNRQLDQA